MELCFSAVWIGLARANGSQQMCQDVDLTGIKCPDDVGDLVGRPGAHLGIRCNQPASNGHHGRIHVHVDIMTEAGERNALNSA